MASANDYIKGYINSIVNYNTGKYDSHGIEDVFQRSRSAWFENTLFRDAIYEGEKDDMSKYTNEFSDEELLRRLNLLIQGEITSRERLILLSMFSSHWMTTLYSSQSFETLKDKNIKMGGYVDYHKTMPKVFKCSEVNLNVTFKIIKSGIPLRCLDIMGCGGFLLSNFQRDFDEHFTDGQNVALYHSLEEAYDKCKYYLEHDSDRKKVAAAGYETVCKCYNYKYLLNRALDISGLGFLQG